MTDKTPEKDLQEKWGERQSDKFWDYRNLLNYYCAKVCVEEAKGPEVLDMACGNGNMFDQFKEHFERVVGVDASGFQLNIARKRHPDVEFHEMLMEDIDLQDKFDSVFILKALEHVRDPQIAIKKGISLMKDDGVIMIQVPNAEAINRRIAVIMGTLKELGELSPIDLNTFGHRRYYTMDILKNDVEKAGLEVIKSGGVFYKMLSTPQMDWLLAQGKWDEGGYGWGREGAEKEKDWKSEFGRACYEIGKERPRDCNIVWVLCKKKVA